MSAWDIDYNAVHQQQLAVEQQMNALRDAGEKEDSSKMKSLYERWLLLEYIANT